MPSFLILMKVFFSRILFGQQIEVERKALALGERNYDSIVNQKRTEIFSLDQKIKTLQWEKDSIISDSNDRVLLDVKKDELEESKKKLKKMHVSSSLLL